MNKRISLNLLPAFLCALAIAGCTSRGLANSAPMAEYNIGLGASAPVDNRELILKNGEEIFHSPVAGGALTDGWSNPNSESEELSGLGTGVSLAGKHIVPDTVSAYWFSYKNQKYYQIDLKLTPELPNQIETYSKAFGENTSKPALIFLLGPNGEMKAALQVSCTPIYICGKGKKRTTVIGSGVGKEAPGNPKIYLPITKELINEGSIAPIPGIES